MVSINKSPSPEDEFDALPTERKLELLLTLDPADVYEGEPAPRNYWCAQDIATVLGISVRQVNRVVARSLDKLRDAAGNRRLTQTHHQTHTTKK